MLLQSQKFSVEIRLSTTLENGRCEYGKIFDKAKEIEHTFYSPNKLDVRF